MPERATRELLLAGTTPKPFAVPALGGAEVMLRQLSGPESDEIQAAMVEGITVSAEALEAALAAGDDGDQADVGKTRRRVAKAAGSGIEVSLPAIVAGQNRAHMLAAAYGLAEPSLTLEEVREIRTPDVVDQIGREVIARSGLGKGLGALQRFREVAGGPGDAPAAPGGPAAGADAG